MNRDPAGDPAPGDSVEDLSDSESGSDSADGLGTIARHVKDNEKGQKEKDERYHGASESRVWDSSVATL